MFKKFSFIIGYRNRDLQRVKNSLDSLAQQVEQNFDVVFVDYGSEPDISKTVKRLLESYKFPVNYIYNETRGMLWNRAHALNTGLLKSTGEYVIFSDIDLIFTKSYTTDIVKFLNKITFLTHRCYYLPENYSFEMINELEKSKFNRKIPFAYVGLLAVSREKALEINGYDEYFQVWGAEDTDFIWRLKKNGLTQYMLQNKDTTVFHMWHPVSASQTTTPWFLEEQNYLFFNKRLNKIDIGKILYPNDRPALKAFLDSTYMKGCRLDIERLRGQLAFLSFYEIFENLESGELCYLQYRNEDLIYSSGRLIKLVSLLNKIFFKLNNFFHYRLVREELICDKIRFKDIKDFILYFIGVNRNFIEDYFCICSSSEELILVIKKI